MQLNFEGKTKDEVAIERIRTFTPPEGYYVAFSGGKDSIVVLDLVRRANVKHDFHYCLTGIDPPELVYFIRRFYPDVIVDKPKMTIWEGFARNGPPTRLARWCCEILKEHGGEGRFCITGVRAEESPRRARRQMVEHCLKGRGKRFLHPIIDWTYQDIWGYIHRFNLPYCELYDKGFKRIGCIGCPMSTYRALEFKMYPKIRDAWYRAFVRYFEAHKEGLSDRFKDADDMWDWWLQNKSLAEFRKSQENPMFV